MLGVWIAPVTAQLMMILFAMTALPGRVRAESAPQRVARPEGDANLHLSRLWERCTNTALRHLHPQQRRVLLRAKNVRIARTAARHRAVQSKLYRVARIEFDK